MKQNQRIKVALSQLELLAIYAIDRPEASGLLNECITELSNLLTAVSLRLSHGERKNIQQICRAYLAYAELYGGMHKELVLAILLKFGLANQEEKHQYIESVQKSRPSVRLSEILHAEGELKKRKGKFTLYSSPRKSAKNSVQKLSPAGEAWLSLKDHQDSIRHTLGNLKIK